jgi:uridine kinase
MVTSKPYIILIAGASGSGKTTVVNEILKKLGYNNADKAELDKFYHDLSHLSEEARKLYNFDDPKALDWYEIIHVVKSLKEGNSTILPSYNYKTHCREPDKATKIIPKNIIIVEGVMALWSKELRKLADFTIFVNAPLDICLQRRLERDTLPIEQGGRGRTHESVLRQWDTVREMFLLHFAPTERLADLIIPRGGHNEKGIELLVRSLKTLINGDA